MTIQAVKLDQVLNANTASVEKAFKDPLTKPSHIKVSDGDKYGSDVYKKIYRYSHEIWHHDYHTKKALNYRNRAEEFIKLGMYDHALKDANKAIEKDPFYGQYVKAHALLGQGH